MELRDLDDEERLVFVALLREVMAADGEYSEQEKALVAELSARIGADRFRSAMEEARTRFPGRAELKEAAKAIERREARKAMFDVLVKAAAVDGVEEQEVKPLSWLASWWEIYG